MSLVYSSRLVGFAMILAPGLISGCKTSSESRIKAAVSVNGVPGVLISKGVGSDMHPLILRGLKAVGVRTNNYTPTGVGVPIAKDQILTSAPVLAAIIQEMKAYPELPNDVLIGGGIDGKQNEFTVDHADMRYIDPSKAIDPGVWQTFAENPTINPNELLNLGVITIKDPRNFFPPEDIAPLSQNPLAAGDQFYPLDFVKRGSPSDTAYVKSLGIAKVSAVSGRSSDQEHAPSDGFADSLVGNAIIGTAIDLDSVRGSLPFDPDQIDSQYARLTGLLKVGLGGLGLIMEDGRLKLAALSTGWRRPYLPDSFLTTVYVNPHNSRVGFNIRQNFQPDFFPRGYDEHGNPEAAPDMGDDAANKGDAPGSSDPTDKGGSGSADGKGKGKGGR